MTIKEIERAKYAVRQAVKQLDFSLIHSVMKHLNWTFCGSTEPPTVSEIELRALEVGYAAVEKLLSYLEERAVVSDTKFEAVIYAPTEDEPGYVAEIKFILTDGVYDEGFDVEEHLEEYQEELEKQNERRNTFK